MSNLFQNADTLQKVWNSLTRAIPFINEEFSKNGTLYLRTEAPVPGFTREDNTVYLGARFSIFIQGFGVNFWVGVDISNKSTAGEAALYFDGPSNNPAFITALRANSKWQYSSPKTVSDGCRLVSTKGTVLSEKDWFDFINEPLRVLLN